MTNKKKAGLIAAVVAMIAAVGVVIALVVIKSGGSKDESPQETGITANEVSNSSKFDVTVDYSDDDTDTSTDGVSIEYTDSAVKCDDSSVTVDGTKATIKAAGSYVLSGSCSDGGLIIAAGKDDTVHLIFNGVTLNSKDYAAIYETDGANVIVTLVESTKNSISDGSSYQNDSDDSAPSACMDVKGNISINGEGSLDVTGNCANGIKSKDDFKLISGTVNVTAATNGIVGKDSLVVKDGKLTVKSSKDALKSNNDKDTEKGYILIENGTINLTSAEDGIQAQTCLKITDGDVTIVSGGGSANAPAKNNQDKGFGMKFDRNNVTDSTDSSTSDSDSSTSTKGIKSGTDITISGGTFTFDAADDAIHSNGTMTIENGTFNVKTGSHGLHADSQLIVNSGKLTVTQSYEGIEAKDIVINDGEVDITSSDDGFNASDGNSSECTLTFNGGTVSVDASGDGLDSNGDMFMNGGTIYIDGPTNDGNGALDCGDNNNRIVVTGGTLLAIGSSGMAEFPATDSTQYTLGLTPSSAKAGTVIKIKDSYGNEIFNYTSKKTFNSICFSSSDIEKDKEYTVYLDDTECSKITVSDIVSTDGNTNTSGGMMWHGGGMKGDGSFDDGFKGGMGHGNRPGNNSDESTDDSSDTPPQMPSDGSVPSGVPQDNQSVTNDSAA